MRGEGESRINCGPVKDSIACIFILAIGLNSLRANQPGFLEHFYPSHDGGGAGGSGFLGCRIGGAACFSLGMRLSADRAGSSAAETRPLAKSLTPPAVARVPLGKFFPSHGFPYRSRAFP